MRIVFNFLTLLLVTGTIFSQPTYNFLRLDQSPRAAALAGSYVANTDDPNVIFYNPAGISTLQDNPISFSSLFYLLDINSAAITYSQNFEGIGRFGAGIEYINYGTFKGADYLGNETSDFGAGELAAVIGYSNELDQNFYYGANAKFIFSSIADRSSMGLAVDLGLLYTIPEDKWSFGFSVLNLGSQITQYYNTTEELPLDIRLGVSKSLAHLPFTFFASLNKLNEKYDKFSDRLQQFTLGGEFKMSKVIKLRFGYDNEKRKEYKIGGTGGIAGFSLGLGILVSKYHFDYAFSSLGSIGALHRIGISTNL
jgi:hypothetical protein